MYGSKINTQNKFTQNWNTFKKIYIKSVESKLLCVDYAL